MLAIGLGQLKSSVLHVKDWLQDTLTTLSQATTFNSLIPSLAFHWQDRFGLSKGYQHNTISFSERNLGTNIIHNSCV